MSVSLEKQKHFLNLLFMLIKTSRIHDVGNVAFLEPVKQLAQEIHSIFVDETEIKIEAIDDMIYFNQSKVRSDITTFQTFHFFNQLFLEKNIGGIRLINEPSLNELTQFLKFMSSNFDAKTFPVSQINTRLNNLGIANIEFLERVIKQWINQEELATKTTNKMRALRNYSKAISIMKKIDLQPNKKSQTIMKKAKHVVYQLVDLCLDEGFSFFGLSNIKDYDEYTFNHSVNVCVISIAFGKNLGLNKKQIAELGIAALFHDYGKIDIPKNILNKAGGFDEDEWKVMRAHPVHSVKKLLKLNGFVLHDIRKIIAAYEHHRNYDCSGYPNTGFNKPMNFFSKVVSIADAYDAMTTNRVYQRAMTAPVALKILMDHAGTKFDPLLVKAFVSSVGVFPVGTLVKLDSGHLAIVQSIKADVQKHHLPKVLVISTAQEKLLPIHQVVEIDLETNNQNILKALNPIELGVNVSHYLFFDAKPNA